MPLGENDVVIWLDALPNQLFGCDLCRELGSCPQDTRYAEFARSCVERSLHTPAQKVIYYGIFRDDGNGCGPSQKADLHKKVHAELEARVFRHWDAMPSSPAKTRPQSQPDLTVEGLALLSCTSAGPVWPVNLTQKFGHNSAEHQELQTMKEVFEREFPPQAQPQTANGGERPAAKIRVSGQPDFTIEDGKSPLDLERMVDLLVEEPPAQTERRVFALEP